MNVVYDIINHTTFPLVKELKKDSWYKFYNNIFQVKEDYIHDLREIADIPYIYYISLDDNTVYKDSVMGLPKNICIQQAQDEDISIANEIILKNGN